MLKHMLVNLLAVHPSIGLDLQHLYHLLVLAPTLSLRQKTQGKMAKTGDLAKPNEVEPVHFPFGLPCYFCKKFNDGVLNNYSLVINLLIQSFYDVYICHYTYTHYKSF